MDDGLKWVETLEETSVTSLRTLGDLGSKIVVLQGPGPLYGHAMDLVGQSFLVAVSGKMVNPICNNSCLRCGLSHADNLAGFSYSGLSKSLPRVSALYVTEFQLSTVNEILTLLKHKKGCFTETDHVPLVGRFAVLELLAQFVIWQDLVLLVYNYPYEP
ncbi:hypothetical protein C5167_021283 [Papaver somniferum]|uniref:Uncharacterized protein n=1 Tax=Papaver somniferum TaxID=3469 RepID=A0A4Y7IVE6_PAPSO|nr:hypothetical protein C5167_021283 [Papaver somniferum]